MFELPLLTCVVHRENYAESRLVWQTRSVLQLSEEKRDDFPAVPSVPVYLLFTSLPAAIQSTCSYAVAANQP